MNLLQTYLSKNKVKKVLSLKPGQEGFSLIELVVVVAVLAVLSAIAIPQFTNISNKARTAAAMNTVATVAKECAAKIADAGVGANSRYRPPVTIDGYKYDGSGYTPATPAAGWYGAASIATANNGTVTVTTGARSGSSGLINCPNSGTIGLLSENPAEYPNFWYTITDGRKYCNFTAGSNAQTRGCTCVGNACSW